MLKKTRTIQSYLENTGSQQIRNFTHGYPGLKKGKYKSYNPNLRKYSLQLQEKLEIADDLDEILLNKGVHKISVLKTFQIPRDTTGWTLSLVKLKTQPLQPF